jgi:membrane-bound metal-dependent hydrolase YbcI (DUF457 family)
MFIGHYALGLATKRVEPRLPLWVLLAAPQALDLVWPILVLAGVEHVEVSPGDTAFTPLRFVSYPWSHSLVMSIVWGVALGAFLRVRGTSLRGAGVVAALVVSHWVLDFASHREDMPLWPGGGPLLGLGLWRSVPATLIVEIGMYAAGIALYARATRSKDRTGTWSFVGLVAFLFVAYVINLLGPPPPSATAVAVSALALWLIPLWGVWIEKHREAAPLPPSGS